MGNPALRVKRTLGHFLRCISRELFVIPRRALCHSLRNLISFPAKSYVIPCVAGNLSRVGNRKASLPADEDYPFGVMT